MVQVEEHHNPQVEEMAGKSNTFKSWWIPLVSLIFLGLNFLWLPFRDKDFQFNPFLYSDPQGKDIVVNFTEYIDYSIRSIPYLIIIGLLIKFMPKYKRELVVCFAAWFGWFIDFFITFNEPLGFILVFGIHWPFSYSFIMAVCLLIWFWYDFLNE